MKIHLLSDLHSDIDGNDCRRRGACLRAAVHVGSSERDRIAQPARMCGSRARNQPGAHAPGVRPFDAGGPHRRHDPLAPGGRVDVEGGPKVTALARAFNEMLDRLEAEQRESARRALMVQEGERQRVARELHDEVGQTLTRASCPG